MGQYCSINSISCADCSYITSRDILSEPSLRIDFSNYLNSAHDDMKDLSANCIEKIDNPLSLYEKEFENSRANTKLHREDSVSNDFYKPGYSTKTKIMSSNKSEKSFNLIDRLSKTNDTDKSYSSIIPN